MALARGAGAHRAVAVATAAGVERYVVDARELPSYEWVHSLAFAATGNRFAFAGRRGAADWLVLDGEAVQSFARITHLALSADGARWACVLPDEADGDVVAHGERRHGRYRQVVTLALSDDGTQAAWAVAERGGFSVYHDGNRKGSCGQHLPRFAPCTNALVFGARDAGSDWLVTPAGLAGPFDRLLGIHFSEDGTRAACVVVHGREVWRRIVPL